MVIMVPLHLLQRNERVLLFKASTQAYSILRTAQLLFVSFCIIKLLAVKMLYLGLQYLDHVQIAKLQGLNV